QRKVIYKRRDQVLEDADLREETLVALEDAVDSVVGTYCASTADDEWDIEGLYNEVGGFWPTELSTDELGEADSVDAMRTMLLDEATAYYEKREEELTPDVLRQIERQVMLNIIDQHWREHLLEMDYLQEGINLRAMGQKDPLVEWQREGYEMFGVMMSSIAEDFVKYVMHAQVVRDEPSTEADVRDLATSGPADDGSGASMAAAARAQAAATGEAPPAVEPETQAPVVKSEWDKTPRNAPCPCGSGKKFKHCHGA
ncbi:MAG: SEC-C domain-containing protein, partial [Acidimicrobiales bacterium]|nr:SEC-C domain-containing protein [Acidimicrobiales bacterium]